MSFGLPFYGCFEVSRWDKGRLHSKMPQLHSHAILGQIFLRGCPSVVFPCNPGNILQVKTIIGMLYNREHFLKNFNCFSDFPIRALCVCKTGSCYIVIRMRKQIICILQNVTRWISCGLINGAKLLFSVLNLGLPLDPPFWVQGKAYTV